MTARDASPVAEGEVLAGKYKVEKVLGVGGMGVVVAATHRTLRQRVAIKFLLHGASDEVVTRFLREARAAVRLKSDHVAKVIDVGELENGAPFMVMEYLDGTDLAATIRTAGKLPVATAVDYVLQACEAIAEAHVAGIVHRDLKPANLFLTKGADGSPMIKVLDFGISKDAGAEAAEEEQGLTKTTAVLGSPSFMAPEQMRSTKSADARADIWSLGVILYQLLTKTLPYKAPSFLELVMLVLHEDAPPPTSRRIDIPPALEAAIMRCLERDRDKRFASVTELAISIAAFGGPDAKRSAERIARTQGLESKGDERAAIGEPASSEASTPEPGPASGRSGGHLSRSAQPAAVSTLESANAASAPAPPPSREPPSAIEAQPISARAQAKTGNTWATADSAAHKAAPTARRPRGRMWLVGGVGLLCGGIVAWFVVVGMHDRAAGAAAASGALPSSPVLEAAPSSAGAAAPTSSATAPTSPSAAPSEDASDRAAPAESAAPPTRAPRHAGGASPRVHASAEPRVDDVAKDPRSRPAEAVVVPPPVQPPPPATTPKPKKNPLDLEIK